MKHNVKYEFGCIMALLNDDSSKKIIKFGKLLIPDECLYFEEGQEYGRELESHITIKFGLTNNYSEEKVGKLVSHIKPFKAILKKISIFRNPKFDVVKFDVISDTLNKLNQLFSRLPNKDEHPVYHPHLTIAYVKPGLGESFIKNIEPIEVSLNRIKYSNPIGKYFYNLYD